MECIKIVTDENYEVSDEAYHMENIKSLDPLL